MLLQKSFDLINQTEHFVHFAQVHTSDLLNTCINSTVHQHQPLRMVVLNNKFSNIHI